MLYNLLVTTKQTIEAKTLEEARKKVLQSTKDVTKIDKAENIRTLAQNRALHLWYSLLAEALNEAGYDMKKVLRQDVDIPWTLENVKENLWRPVQRAYFGKKSTTQLNTLELDKIYEVINKTIGERTGIFVPFPSIEILNAK